MRKVIKMWLIAAVALVVLGLIVFTSVMTLYGWNFATLNTAKYETNTYKITDGFSDIKIKTETSNIVFAPSEDGECTVVCYELKSAKHSVRVQDNTLTVNSIDKRKWYEYIGIMIGTPKITVYLPSDQYGAICLEESTGNVQIPDCFKFESIDISTSTGNIRSAASASSFIKMKTSTGDIRIENATANSFDLSVSTGDINVSKITSENDLNIKVTTGNIKLTDVSCRAITSSGSTGNVYLNGVLAKDELSIKRSTGDIKFDGCDAAEIYIKTSTGNVSGTLLSDKVFYVDTDTGNIDVPNTETGGRCEIKTDTGNVKIRIK